MARTDRLAQRYAIPALVVSGAGHVIHNLADFPVTILLGLETLVPLTVTVLLGVAFVYRPGQSTYAAAALWALVVILGGGMTVIPFGFLPFVPDQSISHYVVHLLYIVTQLPLLWVGIRGVRHTNVRR